MLPKGLFGQFDFNQRASKVDIDRLAARYNDPVCWSKVLQKKVGEHN